MAAHQRLFHWRQRFPFLLGEDGLAADLLALGPRIGMDGAAAVEALAGGVVERIPCSAHIRPFGISPRSRHLDGAQQGCLRRHRLEGRIRVPGAIALQKQAQPVVRRGNRPGGIDVGEQRDFRPQRALRKRAFQPPEAAAEGQVLGLREVDRGEDQHRVFVERGLDGLPLRRRQRGQANVRHHRAERTRARFHVHSEPFVDGAAAMRGSGATAMRNARPNALNTVSA